MTCSRPSEWIEIDIYTSSQGIEIICSLLNDIGIDGFLIKDAEDFKEFLEDTKGSWDYIDDGLMELKSCETAVTVYLPDDASGLETLSQIKTILVSLKQKDSGGELGRLEAEVKNIKEEDWANNWKEFFKPLRIGRNIIIKPSWETVEKVGDEKVLEIDPESSFGTGRHDTTRLCLENLEEFVTEHCRVLDLGCGSGIIGIAAMLLGADELCAVDIDDNSVKTAERNIRKNGIDAEKCKIFKGDITSDETLRNRIGGGYDIVAANIVSDVLTAMSPFFGEFLKDGGLLLVSGIISKRKQEVFDIIKRNGFKHIKTNESDEWVSAAFTKG